MPDYFWEWYKEKGYEEILTKELCFQNKPFITGCCIEYLIEKGQKINNLNRYDSIEEMLNYLRTGVAWSR